ncbi:sensor histidine kinase [Desulfotomaculum sp. 1211_IL3151]|uniref:sensor histidine kinase n=1 Tax=Desulfotomaculum sp. 1211_IL3151 TaxID=3084055 RepID=UPI002FDB8C4E
MKNLSLTVKIWLAISVVSLSLYLVVLIFTPHLIRSFFNDKMLEPVPPREPPRSQVEPLNDRGFHIRSFIMLGDGTTLPLQAKQAFQQSFLQEIKQNAESQLLSKELYESRNGQIAIRYVIIKDMAYERPLYQVMFLRKPEEDRFVKEFLFNLMLYVGLALVASWFVSLFIVRYLTRPLTLMEQHVKRIANRNWHEPLAIKRNDEIGQLAASIDTMRQQLIQQDETQQTMLQNISHELKTPVMVIRSYAQAMKDGIYPKGDPNGSIEVIDEEGARLEKLIKQLLYLTRLDYLSNRKPMQEEVQFDKLIEKSVQRLSLQRPDITLQLDLQEGTVMGDAETLRAMVENLFDNHLRYAKSRIEINLRFNRNHEVMLTLWNDGSQIEPHILQGIFKPFQKGHEGKYGLGLTIVQRILKLHQGEIVLTNERDGVLSVVKMKVD